MPVYEYIHVRTGRQVEFAVPITGRDRVKGHRRVAIPRRLNVVLGAPNPSEPESSVPRALKQLEQTSDHRKIAKESGFSTQEMKRIWGI